VARWRLARIRSLGTIVVVIAASLTAAAAADAKQRARPDLALTKTGDDVATPDYGFQSETGSFDTIWTVKNKGTATSPKSEVRVALLSPLGGRIDVMIDPVPKLKPGKSFSTLVEDTRKLNMELGGYKAEICVIPHFKQLHNRKANDCRDVPKRYFVGKRSWTGTGSGSSTYSTGGVTATQSWQAPALTYNFGSYASPGRFTYNLAGGSVNYQVSGSNSDCTSAGGSTVGISGGELKLDYGASRYNIKAETPAATQVPYVITCNGQSANTYTFALTPFVTDAGQPPVLAFGETNLHEQRQTSLSGATVTLNWDLK
jgi:hypothetical protein